MSDKEITKIELSLLDHILRPSERDEEPNSYLIRERVIHMQGSAQSRLKTGRPRRVKQRDGRIVEVVREEDEMGYYKNQAGRQTPTTIAMSIVYNLGDALYDILKDKVDTREIVIARQVTNDDFIDYAVELIERHVTDEVKQAKIDEITYLDDNYQENSQDWERENPGYSTQMITMESYMNRKKELEAELKGETK